MTDTVGKKAIELVEKSDNKHSVVDQTQESLTEFEQNVLETAEKGLKQYNSDFFIVVLTKKEKLFDNIFRNFFLHRKSCPTPEYDQTVYHYIYSADALKYLWTVPDRDTVLMYRDNSKDVVEEEKQLLGYSLSFLNGDLDRLSRKLNKEPGDTPYLQNINVVINDQG